MLKYLFAAILLAHGFIHILGFTKAFRLGNTKQINSPISKPIGWVWLFTSILFIVSALIWFFKIEQWSIVCICAIILSQTLIVSVWKDARIGTFANIILLVVALPQLGTLIFSRKNEKEQLAILQKAIIVAPAGNIEEENLEKVPNTIRQWLINSGVLHKPRITSVRLKQSGRMKLKQGGNWLNFTAVQYINAIEPSFIWTTKVEMPGGLFFTGRDKLEHGVGYMTIKLASLFNIVNQGNNPAINSGSAQRFLAESCWFPSAALEPYITWQLLDNRKVKGILKQNAFSVEGIFTFLPNGDLQSFETERYFGGGPEAKKEIWHISITSYKNFEGYHLPDKIKVSWKLKDGDFVWLEMHVTELEINKNDLFH